MSDQREIFLRVQELFRLKAGLSAEERKMHICGSGFQEKGWEFIVRDELCREVLGDRPPHRVALVCDAGLGKTTNMEWLQAHLAERGGRQLPVLLRLDTSGGVELLEEELKTPSRMPVLNWLVEEIFRAGASGHVANHLAALTRLQSQGRITLLIDGLDHAINRPSIKANLGKMLQSAQWRNCPIWIAGRPTAFEARYPDLFTNEQWHFMRVAPLAEKEIRFYMTRRANGDWHDVIPEQGRPLLTIPRFLRLICGIIRGKISHMEKDEVKHEAVRQLKLNTGADVYCKAFFELGDEFELDPDPNTLGLLLQGLQGASACLGLGKEEDPTWNNRGRRVERAAALLGALAFQMFDSKDGTSNFSGVKLNPFQDRAARRFVDAEVGTKAEFERDFSLLRNMNVHALDFLLFRESNERRLAFRDRTTQAFFAAYWACRWAKLSELDVTRKWVVDDLFGKNQEYREFWQFAAEMPDEGLPRNEDGEVDETRWLTMFRPLYDGAVKDDEGPIRSTEFIYRSWPRMEASEAGRKIIAKEFRAEQGIVAAMGEVFIPLVSSGKPQDTGKFQMGEGDEQRQVSVSPYLLYPYCVTNLEYEQFDPRHRKLRWYGKKHPTVEETGNEAADDACPVVSVSWYDGWCFAKYLGLLERDGKRYEISLPSDAQWEYACRAGSAGAYCFGDAPEMLGEYAWFAANADGRTHPVGQKKSNDWGLYDMHGNVWEWCQDSYFSESSHRLFRGGSWRDQAALCTAAFRFSSEPGFALINLGFRLLAVSSKAEPSKRSGGT